MDSASDVAAGDISWVAVPQPFQQWKNSRVPEISEAVDQPALGGSGRDKMPVVKAVEVAAAQGSRPVSHKLAPVADVTLTAVQRAVKKYYRVNNLCFRCGSSEHGVAHCSHPPPGAVSESCLAASSDESAAMDSSVDGVRNDNAGTPAVLSVADGSSSRHMDLPWETAVESGSSSDVRQVVAVSLLHQAVIITSQNMPGLSVVCVAR